MQVKFALTRARVPVKKYPLPSKAGEHPSSGLRARGPKASACQGVIFINIIGLLIAKYYL